MLSRFFVIRLIGRKSACCRVGYFGIGLFPLARTTAGSILLIGALAGPAGQVRQDGLTLFRQPFATDSCQLSLLPGD